MRQYEPANIRNIALVGHGGAGKTMLAEALLYAAGATTRMGKIEDGTAATDYEPEEHKHQISVSLGVAPIEWNGFKINVIDCPGQPDFVGDVVSALRVADAVVFVLSAVDGVEVQHELIWDMVEDLGLPRLIVINKMDRERASFQNTLKQLQNAFGTKPFPLHVPIGEEHDFKGVVDLLKMQSLNYDQKTPMGSSGEIPADIQSQVDDLRGQLVEAAAEGDDALLEKYLEEGDLDEKEIATGLSGAVASGATAPVLVSSATHLVGIDLIADEICALVPSPLERPDAVGTSKPGAEDEVVRKPSPGEPLSAYVFKSISDPYVGKISLFRVISGSMRPDHHVLNSRGDDERVAQVFYMSGKEHVNAPEIVCGDIGAVAKLAHTHTGDTLSEPKSQVVYPPIQFPDPVLSIALAPKSHGDEDKLMSAISRLVEEDPVLRVERRAETHQTVASGLGEAHLGVVMERMKRKFGVEVEQLQLRIPYRETIRGSAQYESRYIKQSGGRGQYAVASIQVDAQPEGAGYEFVNKISGGAVPAELHPVRGQGRAGSAAGRSSGRLLRRRCEGDLVRRQVPHSRLVRHGFPDLRFDRVQGSVQARTTDTAGALGGRRDQGPRGDARRHHGRHQRQARTGARHRARPSRISTGPCSGPAGRDGSLRDRPAFDDRGPGDLLAVTVALRRSAPAPPAARHRRRRTTEGRSRQELASI